MTREQLDELSIYTLRELARKIGVASPTSKKKDDLINGIIEIQEGKVAPYVAKTKQGRPPKGLGYDFSNVFNSPVSASFALKQNTGDENEILGSVVGFVEILVGNSAFLWVNVDEDYVCYYISPEITIQSNLKTGDKVKASVKVEDNQMLVEKINSVNGGECKIVNRNDYFSIDHICPSRPMKFSKEENKKLGIMYGESVYFYGSNNNNNTLAIASLVEDAQNVEKIYLNISIADKNKYLLQNFKDSEKFISQITNSVDMAKKIVGLAVERAKRAMESGKDVLLVVDDVNSISSLVEMDDSILKNLMVVTKNSTLGSITLFAIIPNRQISWYEKLADKRFKIENEKIEELI